jgi:hypothetical protein
MDSAPLNMGIFKTTISVQLHAMSHYEEDQTCLSLSRKASNYHPQIKSPRLWLA